MILQDFYYSFLSRRASLSSFPRVGRSVVVCTRLHSFEGVEKDPLTLALSKERERERERERQREEDVIFLSEGRSKTQPQSDSVKNQEKEKDGF